ncbi:MAG: undecaprenyl-diphosphate phosphatase [Planctomycetaceae bacterium]|nr:undecaprenyl-diphosphate phosphatase [Planctomycetaceae bacterium]
MEAWQAALLGLVEGLTEYLPVSSTGHLILVQRALGLEASAAHNAFAICIQAGAIAAVALLYRERLLQMLRGLAGSDPAGRRLFLRVIAAFVPAAVLGKLFDEKIEELLFGLWPVVAAWAVGGVVILFVARRRAGADPLRGKPLEELSLGGAVVIGLVQCLAMWPGTSRSLATILGGLGLGLALPAALEFSFLLGLVTLSAATAYKGLKDGSTMVNELGLSAIVIGFVVAAASAWASVRWMVGYLERRGLALFGWWRLALAALVAFLLASGTWEAR